MTDSDLKSIFGRRLKAARKARGMTQEELGHAINVDYKHLGAIERGAKAPSFELVDRIADALKVEPYKLFLPDDVEREDVDADLKAVLQEMRGMQRTAIRGFFMNTLRIIKKLDD